MFFFCTQTACKDTAFFGHMQVLWRKLNWGMWFLTVWGGEKTPVFSLDHLSVLRSSYFTTFKRLFLCSLCELARRTYSSYRPPDAISVRLFRFMFRFCSKWQFPKKRQTGAKPLHRRMAQGRKDYPTHARARKWGIRDAQRKFHGKIADEKL